MKNKNWNGINSISFQIIALALVFIAVLSSCKKSDQDLEYEEMLIGRWGPFNEKEELIANLPIYILNEDNEGYTKMPGHDSKDEMQWEVKSGQLRVYYKRAPSGYVVAYDQYHQRSVYRLEKVEKNTAKVVMYLYTGFQREFYMRRVDDNNEII